MYGLLSSPAKVDFRLFARRVLKESRKVRMREVDLSGTGLVSLRDIPVGPLK